MSCRKTVESFSPIEIKITCIDRNALAQIEQTATCAVKQKLNKLNIITKNLNVYCYDNALLINDRYGISKDLEEIARAFGLDIKPVECGLRGKTYIVQDELTEIIRQINSKFSIGEYANCQITEEIKSLIKKNKSKVSEDSELSEIFKEIQSTGVYILEGRQKITSVYYDGRLISETKEVISDKSRIVDKLKNYMTETKETLERANGNLRDGTVKILYSRARQMGYAVKEERKGTQVQLVLVRVG